MVHGWLYCIVGCAVCTTDCTALLNACWLCAALMHWMYCADSWQCCTAACMVDCTADCRDCTALLNVYGNDSITAVHVLGTRLIVLHCWMCCLYGWLYCTHASHICTQLTRSASWFSTITVIKDLCGRSWGICRPNFKPLSGIQLFYLRVHPSCGTSSVNLVHKFLMW